MGFPLKAQDISTRNRLARLVWGAVRTCIFQLLPRSAHTLRVRILNLMGAQVHPTCHIYGGAKIWAPWNLVCHPYAVVANGAEVYNVQRVTLGRRAVVSQNAYLCTASHDVDDADFSLIAGEISIENHAWVASRATVLPGVIVGEGAVLALGAVASKDLAPWGIYAGMPARRIRERNPELRTVLTANWQPQQGGSGSSS